MAIHEEQKPFSVGIANLLSMDSARDASGCEYSKNNPGKVSLLHDDVDLVRQKALDGLELAIGPLYL